MRHSCLHSVNGGLFHIAKWALRADRKWAIPVWREAAPVGSIKYICLPDSWVSG